MSDTRQQHKHGAARNIYCFTHSSVRQSDAIQMPAAVTRRSDPVTVSHYGRFLCRLTPGAIKGKQIVRSKHLIYTVTAGIAHGEYLEQ
jgi:hypothetical protein